MVPGTAVAGGAPAAVPLTGLDGTVFLDAGAASAVKSIRPDADWSSFGALEGFLTSSGGGDASVPLRVYFFLVTGEDLYYRTILPVVAAGGRRRVAVDLSPSSAQWTPVGHHRPWCGLDLADVREFGVKVFAPRAGGGGLKLSGFRLKPASSSGGAEPEPRVYHPKLVRVSRGLFALSFLVFPEIERPFQPQQAPVVEILTPDGDTLSARAFLFQEYTALREPVEALSDLVPRGLPEWRVNFRAGGSGECAYRISLPDGSFLAEGSVRLESAEPASYPLVKPLEAYRSAVMRLPLPPVRAFCPAGSGGWSRADGAAPGKGWYIPIEWRSGWGHYRGLGWYDLRTAFLADALLLGAEERLPVIVCHQKELEDDWTFRWGANPLNSDLGGPLSGPSGFFMRAGARKAVFDRALYMARRWGLFPSVNGVAAAVETPFPGATGWHAALAKTLRDERVEAWSSNPGALPVRKEIRLASGDGKGLLRPETQVSPYQKIEMLPPGDAGEGAVLLRSTAPWWEGEPPVLELRLKGAVSLAGVTHLVAEIRLPPDAPPAARVQFFLRDGEYDWYQQMAPGLLRPGDLNTVVVPLDEGWEKGAGSADYNPYTRQDVREVGVRIFCNAPFKGAVELRKVAALRFGYEKPERLHFKWVKVPEKPVPVWGKAEIAFDLGPVFDNPFDPRVIDVAGEVRFPSGKTVRFPAFFFQDFEREEGPGGEEVLRPKGRPHWLWRFAPPEPGRYRVRLKASFNSGAETAESPLLSFSAVPSGGKGPVKVLGRNAFGFSDGSVFYPVGLNLRSPSDERDAGRDPGVLPMVKRAAVRGTFQYDDYFRKMARHGLNWARVWMCSWWLGLEWYRNWPGYKGKGRYNLANAWRLDHLLSEAEKTGVYIQLCLMNHGQVSTRIDHEWEYHPYNYYEPEAYEPSSRRKDRELRLRTDAEKYRRPGGFIKDPVDFFTDEEARRLVKNRLRYVVARWGYSSNIFAWVLSSEVEFTAEYWKRAYDKGKRYPDGKEHSPLTAAWHREMARFIKSIDPFGHMVSTHFSHPQRGPDVWAVKELDFVQSNAYSTFWWFGGFGRDVERYHKANRRNPFVGSPAVDVPKAIRIYDARYMARWKRPVIVGEWGGHWMSNPRYFLDAELHTGTWAMVCSPMAGATGFWWWPHVFFRDKFGLMEPAVRFAATAERPPDGIRWMQADLAGAPEGFTALASGRPDWGADAYVYFGSSAQRGAEVESEDGRHDGRRRFRIRHVLGLPQNLGNRPAAEDVTLRLGPLDAGRFSVEFWDAWTGEVIGRTGVSVSSRSRGGTDGTLSVSLPPFEGELAVRVRKERPAGEGSSAGGSAGGR